MSPKHPLLCRQLRKSGLTDDGAPPSREVWLAFLERLDRTYLEADRDRYTLERSLSLSSSELQELNEELRRSAESQIAAHRDELQRTVGLLSGTNLFLDSIVENIPDMVFALDAVELRFGRLNRAGEELLGLRRADVVGRAPRELFSASEAETFEGLARNALQTRALAEASEHTMVTRKGKRYLHTKVLPLLGPNGSPTHVLGISADITEKKTMQQILWRSNADLEKRIEERTLALRAAQDRLRTAQKMEAVGRLAGGVAHDFNNMLAVILGCAEMLIDEVGSDSPLCQDLNDIRGAGQRAAALTQSLLAFSRQQVLQPVVLDLNDIVRDMGNMVSRLIGEDVECVVHLGSHLGLVEVDPSQLQQVILNLAVNARDAMPEGGRLEITTAGQEILADSEPDSARAGRYVVLSVRDTGIGMSEELQTRIFEPFFTTKERGRGTGLGLATVYGIVKQSGGNISVQSKLGEGSIFRASFPRASVEASKRTPLPPAGVQTGGMESILLVEDDEAVRRTIARVLAKRGYNVIEARDGEEALRLAESQPVDALLTDMVMPRMGGRALADALVAKRSSLRVMYVSGYMEEAADRRIGVAPGRRFLRKPFSPSVLLRAVRELLDEGDL